MRVKGYVQIIAVVREPHIAHSERAEYVVDFADERPPRPLDPKSAHRRDAHPTRAGGVKPTTGAGAAAGAK